MIFVDLLEVAPAKSPASTRTVFKPRSCASSAQPAPVAPPPMTQTSNDWPLMLESVSSRVLIEFPVPDHGPADPVLSTGVTARAVDAARVDGRREVVRTNAHAQGGSSKCI